MRSKILVGLMLASTWANGMEYRQGENLLQSFPVPGDSWKESSKTIGQIYLNLWEHKESEDFFMTKSDKTMKGFPAKHAKSALESGLEQQCKSHTSELITKEKINGYKRELWLNTCQLDDKTNISMLQLYIQGKEYGHHILRRWTGKLDETDKSIWVDYMKNIGLCNTEKKKNACPAIEAEKG